MRTKLETAVTLTIGVAALLVSAAAIRLVFFLPTPEPSRTGPSTPELLDEAAWNEILEAEIPLRGTSGPHPIMVVEFMDLECPFCRRSHVAISEARKEFADSAGHMVVHFPLDFHRFAVPAARASECADLEDRFPEFVDLIFEKQDSLGMKTWVSYAVEAGIKDTLQFKECNARRDTLPRVERGRELGDKIDIQSTPTILINGWLLPEPPRDAEAYVDIVRRILTGAPPYRPLAG